MGAVCWVLLVERCQLGAVSWALGGLLGWWPWLPGCDAALHTSQLGRLLLCWPRPSAFVSLPVLLQRCHCCIAASPCMVASPCTILLLTLCSRPPRRPSCCSPRIGVARRGTACKLTKWKTLPITPSPASTRFHLLPPCRSASPSRRLWQRGWPPARRCPALPRLLRPRRPRAQRRQPPLPRPRPRRPPRSARWMCSCWGCSASWARQRWTCRWGGRAGPATGCQRRALLPRNAPIACAEGRLGAIADLGSNS